MSDYIKDLNIIDFLGIIVPGSILVLLISGDNADLLLLWTSYFGADASSLVRSIFLAIAGYLAGMILHEIGDLAEKGVWCFTRLDPKAYAINAVGVEALNDAATTAKLNDQVTADQHCVFLPWFRGVLGCILAVVILGSCTLGFSYAMQSAVNDATTLMTTTYTSQDVNTVPVDVATSANALGAVDVAQVTLDASPIAIDTVSSLAGDDIGATSLEVQAKIRKGNFILHCSHLHHREYHPPALRCKPL